MCFTIPYKVLKVQKNHVVIEGDKKISIENDLNIEVGDYIRVSANIAVDHLTKEEAKRILNLIKSVYKNNE